MAFHGTKGTFQFDVDSSIPQKENEIQGDSRYTREFKRNESIVIRVPLGSGLMTERGGVYDTFSVPYSEVVVWNIGYFPTPLKVPHNPETYFFDDSYLCSMSEHVFASEADGRITISRNTNSFGLASPNIPKSRNTVLEGSSGLTGDAIVRIGAAMSVPYLWGSVIEGVDSGARRFIVGPLLNYASNPALGGFCGTEVDAFGKYGDVACSGTGDYASGDLRFVMPYSGEEQTQEKTRHDLFKYVADTNVVKSSPFNPQFLIDTPFSSSNINYSGIRLRDRKGLPTPYAIPDKETIDSFVHGTNIEPDKTVYGSSGNTTTAFWFAGGLNPNPTRRSAWAITKRHVLATPGPRHNYAFCPSDHLKRDFYGYVTAVTGSVPFTDSDEYGQGDTIQFWDSVNHQVIERTIVGTKTIDMETIHSAIDAIVGGGAFPQLNTDWQCVNQWFAEYGVTGLACSVAGANFGYSLDALFSNVMETLRDSEAIGGDVCTSLVAANGRWVENSFLIDDESSLSDYFVELQDVMRKKKFVDKYLFNEMIDLSGSGISGFESFGNINPIGFDGVRSTAPGATDSIFPHLYPTTMNDTNKTGVVLSLDIVSILKGIVPLPNEFKNEMLHGIATIPNSQSEMIDAGILGTERFRSEIGTYAFSAAPPTHRGITQRSIGNSEIGIATGGEILPLPPKETDKTLIVSAVENQFPYLPTAAHSAIKEYFPHGLNNIFYGSFSPTDSFRKSITWNYLVSHFKDLLSAHCSIHILNADLPDGVVPLSFIDYRRSVLHNHEIFLDDQMKGSTVKNCAPRSFFYPYHPYGRYGVESGILSVGAAYSNPYGNSMLNFEFSKVGKCNSNVSNLLDPCEEEPGTTSGTECRWGVWLITVGQGGPANAVRGTPMDYTEQKRCSSCWYDDPSDPTSTIMPTNTVKGDVLNDFSNHGSVYIGGDLPAAMYTHYKNKLILSRLVVGSQYSGSYSGFDYLYEYTITGHYGKELVEGDFVFQNFDGSTGSGSPYPGGSTSMCRVFRHSKNEGRLTLYGCQHSSIYSDDVLLRCSTTVAPNRVVPTEPQYIYSSVDLPCTTGASGDVNFKHTFGMTAYIHTNDGMGWAHLINGGSRVMGTYAFLGPWWQGFPFQSVIPGGYPLYDDCSVPSYDETSILDYRKRKESFPHVLGEGNILNLGTHNMGMFLSDQPIYYRKSNPSDIYPYYNFGKVSDIFYHILNNLNREHGVTGTYLCDKQIIQYDPLASDFNQPFSDNYVPPTPLPPVPKTFHPPGSYINEQEFLK